MQPEELHKELILLYEVQYTLTQTHFRELFADASTHLWNRYVTAHRYNLLAFYANLDTEKKTVLCKYLSTYNPRAL
ncbi:MAG: hypothetical protein LBL04_02095 [Bacteroidales bacterium]|jgi:hypothetical protein|nr:hypothetical protein [Bacteroidales bacterium]